MVGIRHVWLPRTTDYPTYFVQSLEIRGIESRLYLVQYMLHQIKAKQLNTNVPVLMSPLSQSSLSEEEF